jgi:hypothetical protein
VKIDLTFFIQINLVCRLYFLCDRIVHPMKDLNMITAILCNYYNHRELESAEMEILCDWLNESQANEDFLTELSDDETWTGNSPASEIHEIIRSKLRSLYGR